MKRVLIAVAVIALVGMALVGGGLGLAVAQGEAAPVRTFLERVAEKLGISEDELRSAMTEAQQEIIDERVAAGRLTPEQGERLKERIEEYGLLGPRDRLRIRDEVCRRAGRLTLGSAAAALGVEPQELARQLKDGKTLTQIAQERGLAADDFEAAFLQDVQRKLNALVADGKLTQSQADGIFQRIEGNIDRIVEAPPGRLYCACDTRQ